MINSPRSLTMTTEAAAALYLAEYQQKIGNRNTVIYNPLNKDVKDLPRIFGFNNGGPKEWLSAVALAENGVVLGSHICSYEAYMPGDLGILEGTRPDRHEKDYRVHYPDGYRMVWVSSQDFAENTPDAEFILALAAAAENSQGE